MKLFLFISIFLIINTLIHEDNLHNYFLTFKQNYNKSYSNKEDESKRFENFKKNYEKYQFVNQFSDVADYEQAIEEYKKTQELPESINYSNKLGVAKAQLNCGFCYAFSFIAQIEAQFSIKFGKSVRFSEQELLDCSNDEINCNGGVPEKIKNFLLKRNYLALENSYPAYTGISDPSQCAKISKIEDKYLYTKKFNVEEINFLSGFKKKVSCIKTLLVNFGPLGAGVRANIFDDYKQGIIESSPYKCQINDTKNHAIVIVGYDTDKTTKTSYWIVRNSWGTTFGENGYARVKIGDNICGIEDDIHYIKISWDNWCENGCDECKYDYEKKKLFCESCISGYYYDNNLKHCYKCKDNCKKCTNSVDCNDCNDGYFLSNSFCFQCIIDCKKCNGPAEKDCYEWYYGDSQLVCYSKYLSRFISYIILFLLF